MVLDTKKVQYALYKGNHPAFEQWMKNRHKNTVLTNEQEIILNKISDKSLWIDSAGFTFSKYYPDIISIEDRKYEKVLGKINNVYYKDQLLSVNTNTILNKLINPNFVVFYYSPSFKYVTLPELKVFINQFINSYPQARIILMIDTTFLDFNKIKFTLEYIIDDLKKSIKNNSNCTQVNEKDVIIDVDPANNF